MNEPTNGLDPPACGTCALIRDLTDSGRTMLLSSHNLIHRPHIDLVLLRRSRLGPVTLRPTVTPVNPHAQQPRPARGHVAGSVRAITLQPAHRDPAGHHSVVSAPASQLRSAWYTSRST
jgi:hypothetical protein